METQYVSPINKKRNSVNIEITHLISSSCVAVGLCSVAANFGLKRRICQFFIMFIQWKQGMYPRSIKREISGGPALKAAIGSRRRLPPPST